MRSVEFLTPLLVVSGALGACLKPNPSYCDVPSDCESGVCEVATHTCHVDGELCLGQAGWVVCLPSAPSGEVTLPIEIDTDTDALCLASQPSSWSDAGQPASCIIAGGSIIAAGPVTAGRVLVSGSRPLVLVAADAISVVGELDVASHRGGTNGPGSGIATCAPFPQVPENTGNAAGGGAGGSFMSKGGDGGRGDATAAGLAADADAVAPTLLRGGCAGQSGGTGTAAGGVLGAGGGAIYLVAYNAITIGAMGTINASGAGGTGGLPAPGGAGGGGGAGSGGMIVFDAPTITSAGATIVANGGGGGEGADNNNAGGHGSDPDPESPGTAAAGGDSGSTGSAGGAGNVRAGNASSAVNGGADRGGGGGGGGAGYVRSNAPLAGADVSPQEAGF